MMGLGVGSGLVAMGATALALLFPAAGYASGLPAVEETEAPPGVTITGVGFARLGAPQRSDDRALQRAIDAANPVAVARSIRDARRRAAAIARTVGVQVGEIERIELREISQFGESRPCRRRGAAGPSRCRDSALTAAAITATFAIVGGSPGSDGSRAIQAHGAASVAIEPSNRERNQSIRRAALASRRTVTPEAAATARRNAGNAARAAGLTLGRIISISEAPPLYFGSSFYDAALGAFGPGQFCGFVRRPIFGRDPETGISEVVRRVRERRCMVPQPYSLRLEVGYEVKSG